jgi:hypothetical protein
MNMGMGATNPNMMMTNSAFSMQNPAAAGGMMNPFMTGGGMPFGGNPQMMN